MCQNSHICVRKFPSPSPQENVHYRATASLDIDNNKIENLPEPREDSDAATKKYVDDVAKTLTLDEALVKENGGYNIVMHTLI